MEMPVGLGFLEPSMVRLPISAESGFTNASAPAAVLPLLNSPGVLMSPTFPRHHSYTPSVYWIYERSGKIDKHTHTMETFENRILDTVCIKPGSS